jgi:CRP-like cAMP-binding protein
VLQTNIVGCLVKPRLDANEVLVQEKKRARGVYWIVSGCVKSMFKEERYTARTYLPGASFCECSVLGKPSPLTFVATQNSILLVVEFEDIEYLLDKFFYDKDIFYSNATTEYAFLVKRRQRLNDQANSRNFHLMQNSC